MTTIELAKTPMICTYYDCLGMIGFDPSCSDWLFFLSNRKDGMSNGPLLKAHPEYRCSYAVSYRLSDFGGNIDFVQAGITNIQYPSEPGNLIFKKQTKFSL